MSTKLQVETAELRELAATQTSAASEYTSNAAMTEGASASVFMTHGVVCSGTAMAVSTASSARASAASAMGTVSTGLADRLETAAGHYDQTDTQSAGDLDSTVTGF